MKRLIPVAAAAILAASPVGAATPQLEPMLTTSLVFGGIAISHEGRRFSPFRPQAPGAGPQLAEWVNGEPKPFPDAAWNDWKSGQDPRDAFVGVNAIRIGPDNALWVVDVGSTGIGKVPEIGGPKLVRIDLATNKVSRVYPLGEATWPSSYIDDVRFKGRTAYLTDAGSPGLIVVDLESGAARRVLEGDKTAAQQRPLTAEGKPILSPDKLPVMLHSDQIEISPGGKWLYYQPVTGPLYRIETRWIDDASLDDKKRASHAELFANTGNTGATAMDSNGNIYASDLDSLAIRKIAPDGRITTLIQDPRLLWVDAMWIDNAGYLWLPASQQNRAKAMNGGVSALHPTSTIYRVNLGIKPLAD